MPSRCASRGTYVQTEIYHPTDSGLLVESVRVLSRLVKEAKGLVKDQVSYLERSCRSRWRSARKTAQTLHRQLRCKGEDKEVEQKHLYKKLVKTAEQMVLQASRAMRALSQQSTSDARRLFQEAEKVLPLVEGVIAQTCSRMLEGKKVPSEQKVSASLSHTRVLSRSTKAGRWSSLVGR